MAPTYTNAHLELALDDLAKQEAPNYMATSKKFNIPRKTLYDRFSGRTVSRQEASSETHQCLTAEQEEALISLINRLTNRGLPPTNSIVRNLAEEIIGRRVGKNWSGQFVRRHAEHLTSRYLKNIKRKRQNAEYAPLFQQFYDLVLFNLLAVLLYWVDIILILLSSLPASRNTISQPKTSTTGMRKDS